MSPHAHRIGFISTRFAGTDGVSLETEKWATVLAGLGHTCFYFAGKSDRPAALSRVVPEAFFGHAAIEAISTVAFLDEGGGPEAPEPAAPDMVAIYQASFTSRFRPPQVTQRIHELAEYLQEQVYAFVRDFELDLIVVENALSIPMNIPLGLALTEFLAETGFPAIAHHHDLYWERDRYLVNCVSDYLSMAFPPRLPSIHHVTINSLAATQLALRTGIAARVIPNVMDFEHPPAPPDAYTQDVRAALGLAPDELLFLQPTRVVQRKGIEHAIELTKRLELNARLIISHASGDEGDAYEQRVRQFAALLEVPVNFVSDVINEQRGRLPDGRKIFTLWDVYPYADLITYPSSIEGFGNAFLEAIYFRRPIVVNNYSIYDLDIKPKGFQVIELDGYITEATLRQAHQVLAQPRLAEAMAEQNFRQGRRFFSYAVLEHHLRDMLTECFGDLDMSAP